MVRLRPVELECASVGERAPWRWVWVPALLSLTLGLAACGPSGQARAADEKRPARPAPEVGVITVTPGEVGLQTDLPGRLEASRVAQVRARVAGILQQRLFREGSDVQAGQTLFRIDAATYQAAHHSAQAALARAEALQAQTAALLARYQPLVAEHAISEQEFTQAESAARVAQADVAVARAAVQSTGIQAGYAEVKAPISGRIGRALVTEGALVGQGEATPMALIQQLNPLYVNFTQSVGEVMALRRALASGQLVSAGADAAAVRIVLEDGSEHPQTGRLLFADAAVDPATGQVTLRAELPNPGLTLLPGLYVKVRLQQARATQAVALPQQAVQRSNQGDSVKVVGPDGQIQTRTVEVRGQQGGQWVITGGLQAGEQVMVDGFQKVQMLPPGTPVKAVPWTASGAPQSAAPAGASAPATR